MAHHSLRKSTTAARASSSCAVVNRWVCESCLCELCSPISEGSGTEAGVSANIHPLGHPSSIFVTKLDSQTTLNTPCCTHTDCHNVRPNLKAHCKSGTADRWADPAGFSAGHRCCEELRKSLHLGHWCDVENCSRHGCRSPTLSRSLWSCRWAGPASYSAGHRCCEEFRRCAVENCSRHGCRSPTLPRPSQAAVELTKLGSQLGIAVAKTLEDLLVHGICVQQRTIHVTDADLQSSDDKDHESYRGKHLEKCCNSTVMCVNMVAFQECMLHSGTRRLVSLDAEFKHSKNDKVANEKEVAWQSNAGSTGAWKTMGAWATSLLGDNGQLCLSEHSFRFAFAPSQKQPKKKQSLAN